MYWAGLGGGWLQLGGGGGAALYKKVSNEDINRELTKTYTLMGFYVIRQNMCKNYCLWWFPYRGLIVWKKSTYLGEKLPTG